MLRPSAPTLAAALLAALLLPWAAEAARPPRWGSGCEDYKAGSVRLDSSDGRRARFTHAPEGALRRRRRESGAERVAAAPGLPPSTSQSLWRLQAERRGAATSTRAPRAPTLASSASPPAGSTATPTRWVLLWAARGAAGGAWQRSGRAPASPLTCRRCCLCAYAARCMLLAIWRAISPPSASTTAGSTWWVLLGRSWAQLGRLGRLAGCWVQLGVSGRACERLSHRPTTCH